MTQTLALAADHAGIALKEILKQEAKNLGYDVIDFGANSTESVDYPDYGYLVAGSVASGESSVGVAICGSGVGISIAANRNPKIRAALCHNAEIAKLARQHNDANVLALGARVVDENTAKECLRVFLSTPFEGGRHQKRIDKL